jgi:hypothetical protein
MARPCSCDRPDCGLCAYYRDSPRHRAAWDAGGDSALAHSGPERSNVGPEAFPAGPPAATQRGWCAMIGPRVEFRAGCGGWSCKHGCASDDPAVLVHLGGVPLAVPSDDCQDCIGWQARG